MTNIADPWDEKRAGAVFSEDRKYRYLLWRHLPREVMTCEFPRKAARILTIIGLNPSTADEFSDDPTIRREIDFAGLWGFDLLLKVNLFAFRATDPSVLLTTAAPIGPDNLAWIHRAVSAAERILAAWGNGGEYMGQGAAVRDLYPSLYSFGLTMRGHPKHPLYLRKTSLPMLMSTISTNSLAEGNRSRKRPSDSA